MTILILGAGVIGTTLAYYLSKAGQKVIVIDRSSSVAMETSHANAGQISYGYASPWAAPGVPLKAIGWLLQHHAPLAIKPDWTFDQLKWIMQFLGNCTQAKYTINKSRMLRIANYSKDCLASIRNEHALTYDNRALGTLQLFRTQKQLDAVKNKDIPALEKMKIEHKLLDPNTIADVEPALANMGHKLFGGLYLPGDETGNCQLFTQKIYDLCLTQGVEFRFNTNIDKVLIKYGANNDKINNKEKTAYGVVANGQEILGDQIIVALSSYSKDLLNGLVNLPVYPVKGYSVTADITDVHRAPCSTILDEKYKIAITRLGDKIRVGGMAHICGYNTKLDQSKVDTLNFVLQDLFAGSYVSTKDAWTGLRPATPDGTPIIGRSEIENLWLNTGHGTLGWTMACGSGKLLTDLILGKPTDIVSDDLSIYRYK
jgi:D-amino-acid dehydrogenase